ncbi:MAG: hypothetical protein KatS3mg068_0781 [Candidatus Sericytochromatia bacterium]|nr:MAG: hypothetical protein KatS3mg068_0781 [Candidatus Sericytochromatia bacterium]
MYANPIDKGALYAAMGANAMQYGFYMPNFGALSSAIDKAKNFTTYNKMELKIPLYKKIYFLFNLEDTFSYNFISYFLYKCFLHWKKILHLKMI